MTTLINKIEKLIKREKTTPDRKNDDSKKSSSEILSELFGAFNADPPKIEEVPSKKPKRSKKKHKKERKKRSRSSSTSSDVSEYSRKPKKRKKSKSKKHKDDDRSTPKRLPKLLPKLKLGISNNKTETKVVKSILNVKTKITKTQTLKTKNSDNIKIKEENNDEEFYATPPTTPTTECNSNEFKPINKLSTSLIPVPQTPVVIKPKPVKSTFEVKKPVDHVKKPVDEVKKHVDVVKKSVNEVEKPVDEVKESVDEVKKPVDEVKKPVDELKKPVNEVKEPVDEVKKPVDEIKEPVDEVKEPVDKSKGRIQIKNLKFSAVFEETVKKAEEEARKKAEKGEDGECTATSSSDDEAELNSQFPKSSDPGGILKMQAADEIRAFEKEEEKNKVKKLESSKSKKDKSPSHKRSRSKSKRSRSRSRRRSQSKRHRHRSRSRSRKRSRSRRSTSKSRKHSRSRHRTRSRSRHRSPRLRRRRSRSSTGVKLADSEKKRLLEVARRNAINMLKNGAVPAGAAALPPHTRNQVMAAIQSGGKSVDELTDFCKHLSKKEALGELSSVSSNDENMSDNEDTIAFHHPFLVKEKAPIVMNIRGGAPLPTKTNTLPVANKEELRLQFPVSSGSQHRESEWVPVSPKNDDMQVAVLNKTSSDDLDDLGSEYDKGPLALPEPSKTEPVYMKGFTSGSELHTVPALMAPGPQALPNNMEAKIELGAIVTQKLSLLRKEQEDNELCETRGFGWSKSMLGQFTGSTGAQILTPRELASGTQAWAKKDQLVRAAPVQGGMGMHLLQKMGWTPGQGLGKEGTGTLQPLLLEVKLDTKGLQAREEAIGKYPKSQRIGRRGPAPLVAGGKHPVSLLGEYCSKQKLGPPEYTLCFECGPDHKKNFLFKVKVAGLEYQPAIASANKKQAKADAAQLALQKLGIL